VAKFLGKSSSNIFLPQDSEWAIENGKLYVVQTRPITTMNATTSKNKETVKQAKAISGKLILEGQPASPGVVTGIVNILKSAKEIGKIKRGDILVTDMTTPDFVPAMKRAVAIVTNKGGQTSHAAIEPRVASLCGRYQNRYYNPQTGRVITAMEPLVKSTSPPQSLFRYLCTH
jgi:pyruvate,water dikinase